MRRRLPVQVSYANVTATLALFLALGGTSYAAVTLKRGSVTSREVKDGSLQAMDLAPGVITGGPAGPAGARGARGAEGFPGAKGDTGATGPSDVVLRHREAAVNFALPANSSVEAARFTLPAGKWAVTASVNLINGSNQSLFRCQLSFDGQVFGVNQASDVGGSAGYTQDMTLLGATQSTSPQIVVLTCNHDQTLNPINDLPRVERIRVLATRTTNLDVQAL